jgi:hypothetical protein
MFVESDLANPISEEQKKMLQPIQPQSIKSGIIQRRSERLEQKSATNFSSKSKIIAGMEIIYNPSTPLLFSPNTLSAIRPKLNNDTEQIEALQAEEEEDDEEYIEYDKNYGKIVETWFADTQQCPCCKARGYLRRYSSDIFPVIDLVCINPEHNVFLHGVRYFQVKTSNGRPFAGDTYFSINPTNYGHIYTGSIRAGEPIHLIDATSPAHDKEFLIGYICVLIDYFDPEDDTVNNITVKSINCVLPDINREKGLYYYYIIGAIKPKISWETTNFNIISLSFESRILIPRNYLSTHFYEVSPNPLSGFIRY